MKNSNFSFRVFFLTYAIANLGLVLYGILAIIKPAILLDSFSEYVYQFPADAGIAITYQAALFRLLGHFNLLVGAIGLVLVSQWHREQRSWLAISTMSLTFFAYLGPVVFDNTVGHIGFFEILEHILFAAIIIAGIQMLAKLKTMNQG